ncbi:MAG: bacillithiol system redox-active protein YtxJ [Candidatus Hydrogenedentes bacterium]|nr:bacillithiol system redox-active protein YtxJ [Candidatus Hydrogenedentota bacterium]
MVRIETEAALEAALAQSVREPILLFKHSTACPVSHRAFEEVKRLSGGAFLGVPPIFVILAIENRPLSLAVAEILQIQHQSPQMILVDRGAACWHGSHGGITAKAVSEAVSGHVRQVQGA